MSSRLRTLDSKISFFAFADIITAVSGVLIFVALLLATDLGRPTSSSTAANDDTERQIQEIQEKQAEVDAQNQRLEELLGAAETAPDPAKLQADIDRLQTELAAEQKKQSALATQMTSAEAAMVARDRILGLTEVKAGILRLKEETTEIRNKVSAVRQAVDILKRQLARVDAQLDELHRREGQIWLIPEHSLTTKEPILVTVAGSGATIERFNHPEPGRQFDASQAEAGLNAFLAKAQYTNQYVVFLIRPSGIGLFRKLVYIAMGDNFEVGYDALEETRQIHFSVPPPIDEGPPGKADGASVNPGPGAAPGGAPGGGGSGGSGTAVSGQGAAPGTSTTTAASTVAQTNGPAHATSATAATPPKPKSWWQRLLEWLGIR